MKSYEIRPGYHVKGDPTKIGEELERLEKENNGVKREDVWKSAKKKTSPLHEEFTWDVHAAAEKCWDQEAGYVMRAINVVTYSVVGGGEPQRVSVRSLVSIPDKEDAPHSNVTYYTWEHVVTNADLHKRAVDAAIAYLKGARAKFAEIVELAEVWKIIDNL